MDLRIDKHLLLIGPHSFIQYFHGEGFRLSSLFLYLEVFRLLVFAGFLIVAAYGDVREGRIPNKLVIFGLVSAFILNGLVYGVSNSQLGLLGSFLGVILGAGPFLLFYLVGVAIKKSLMGAGDVKLMAAIGAFAGWLGALQSIYIALLIAFFVALGIVTVQFIKKRPSPKTLPFGSMLAAGTLIAMVWRLSVFSNIIQMFKQL